MELEVKIDFDEASMLWRKNKKYIGGRFVYICNYIHSNGKQCTKTIYSQRIINPYENLELDSAKYIRHKNKDIFCKKHMKVENLKK